MSEEHHTEDHADIREAVAKLCAQFPGEYWRKLDREMAYPKAFVDALTEAGYLSVLIPEEYGGGRPKLSPPAASLERIQRAGGNGARRPEALRGSRDPRGNPARRVQWRRLPRPDVHHGHAAAARQRATKSAMAAEDRQRRGAAARLR